MARLATGLTFLSSFRTLVLMMVQGGLLPVLLLAVTSLAQRCTRAVPVHTYPAEKLKVLRRIPSSCSNWDKTWSWLTNKDCNTKYRMETVEVPPREVRQYKLQHYCCDGADKCEEAENRHSTGFDSTDAKFLAVVLGSTAACVVIVIIIFAITFYTKKSRCVMCDQNSHAYTSAGECSDGEDSREDSSVEDKPYRGEGRSGGDGRSGGGRDRGQCWDSDTEQPEVKGTAGEAVYAEIGDPASGLLPKYKDIFREDGTPAGREVKGGGGGRSKRPRKAKEKDNNPPPNADPFTNASAPPMYTEVSRGKKRAEADPGTGGGRDKGKNATDAYVNAPTALRAPPSLRSGSDTTSAGVDDPEIRVIQPTVHSGSARKVSDGRQQAKQELKLHQSHQRPKEDPRNVNDPKYYNVQEKKKKKRKASSSSGGSTSSAREGGKQQQATAANSRSDTSNAAGSKVRGDSWRSKAGGSTAVAMEMALSKSCSASETMGKTCSSSECSETSLSRSQKRRSAPPGSTIYENQSQSPQHPANQSQNPPQPPQSAVPPRPISITNNNSQNPDTIINMANPSNTCRVIYEAQAPPHIHGNERQPKNTRKPSNPSSSASKNINSAHPSSESPKNHSVSPERKETSATSPHNYENANLVTLSGDNAGITPKGKPASEETQQTSTYSNSSTKTCESVAPDTKNTKLEESAPVSSSSNSQAERASAGAAVLKLSPSAASSPTPFLVSNSESAGSASAPQESKEGSSKTNTYDTLQFEDPKKCLAEKPHSPNTHVYQSLETVNANSLDSTLQCDNSVDSDNNLKCEMFNSLRSDSSSTRSHEDKENGNGELEECESPPPPSLPPRCPIAPNKRVVDGLSV